MTKLIASFLVGLCSFSAVALADSGSVAVSVSASANVASTVVTPAITVPTTDNYESGHDLCDKRYGPLLSDEHGVYIKVPVDYKNPAAGETEIYAYFEKTFDPQKPTLMFFSGGPGQPTHLGLFGDVSVNFNVLLMDQRGIGCSRPADLSLYLSPKFYSSENVARDADLVRKYFSLAKVAVYGISYGTMPATIYASLFPEATQSLILEGVVNSSNVELWEAPHRRKLLQKMLATLPADILAIVNSLSATQGLPDTWFSDMARVFLGFNNGLGSFRTQLLSLNDPVGLKNFVEQVKARTSAPAVGAPVPNPLYAMNEIPYYMISCQEMGMDDMKLSTADSLQNGVLVLAPEVNLQKNCAAVGASATVTYEASGYPVKVPVTYFEGANDGETPSPEAIHHYKTVPQGQKQLLILVDGGHNPNLQIIEDGNALQLNIFTLAVSGQRIPADLMKQINAQKDYFWAFTAK